MHCSPSEDCSALLGKNLVGFDLQVSGNPAGWRFSFSGLLLKFLEVIALTLAALQQIDLN